MLDTNILYANGPFEKSAAWKDLLLYVSKYTHVHFVVPEVVIHERARQEAKRIKKSRGEAITALSKARTAFASAGLDFPDTPTVPELRALVLESRQEIANRMRTTLQAAGVHVGAIPPTDHQTLIDWSVDSHPPFDATDKGYRDALIWRTVREVAQSRAAGSVIIFVTDDGDYRHGDSLHPKLVADLAEVTDNAIAIARTLRAAIEQLNAHAEDHEWIEGPPELDELLRDRIEAACEDLVGEDIGAASEEPATKFDIEIPMVDNATVAEVMPDMSTLSVDVQEDFEGGTVIGEATVQAEVRFEGYATKADTYTEAGDWTVTNFDWNDHYAAVEGEFEAEIDFRFVVVNEDVETLEFAAARAYPKGAGRL
ncbi:PIN domain-containing protein [Mycolicibacterium mageritense]|uniref:PIN domain-containing protein n=1 Tax=Mycolicibacterium mageritense TaxID=53462 RepID=UPI0023F559E6|nr:PIN domain-containing protein [Mycolicibacterium mageritense]